MGQSKIFSACAASLVMLSGLSLSATETEGRALAMAEDAKTVVASSVEVPTSKEFKAFTGKIQGNRVRLRLDPSMEGKILRELTQDDLFLVLSEENDYFAIKPPNDLKAYVYRTFVLDGVIEGSKVNIRLEPHLESPVIAQMNTGDSVTGIVSSVNSKWLEIKVPESTRFYIAKEFVAFAGEESLLADLEQRRSEVHHLVNSAYLIAQAELRKNFTEIDFPRMEKAFEDVIANYTDFPVQVKKAEEVLNLVRETYLQKKVAFLESKTQKSSQNWAQKSQALSEEIASYEQRLADLEGELSFLPIDSVSLANKKEKKEEAPAAKVAVARVEEPLAIIAEAPMETLRDNEELRFPLAIEGSHRPSDLSELMTMWASIEQALFHQWAAKNPGKTSSDFALEEKLNEQVLSGVVEMYTRPVKNRPGDFLLKENKRTVAFLYSTKVDLQEVLGQQVTIRVNKRPNNNFAFPAFHVISAE